MTCVDDFIRLVSSKQVDIETGVGSFPGGPVLTPSFPQMQVQQLLQIKKQQQAAAAAAAAQQKAGQPQQGQATVQQKVRDIQTL